MSIEDRRAAWMLSVRAQLAEESASAVVGDPANLSQPTPSAARTKGRDTRRNAEQAAAGLQPSRRLFPTAVQTTGQQEGSVSLDAGCSHTSNDDDRHLLIDPARHQMAATDSLSPDPPDGGHPSSAYRATSS